MDSERQKYELPYLSVCTIQMLRLWKIIGMLVPLRPLITICVCVSGNMMRMERYNKKQRLEQFLYFLQKMRIVYSEYKIAALVYQRFAI